VTFFPQARPGVCARAPYFVNQKYSPARLEVDKSASYPRLKVTFQVGDDVLFIDQGKPTKLIVTRALSLYMRPTGDPSHTWQADYFQGNTKIGNETADTGSSTP